VVSTCESRCFWLFDVLLYFALLSISRDHYLIQNLRMMHIIWEGQSTFIKAHITGLPMFRVRIESQRSCSMTCAKHFSFSLVADTEIQIFEVIVKLSCWLSERVFQKVCNVYSVVKQCCAETM